MGNGFNLMAIIPYLELFGIPSMFGISVWCARQCIKYTNQLVILMKAQKAQMRSQLLKDFQFYKKRKWISDVELQEWTNQWKAYHDLVGENGVLDDRYQQLLKLPNNPVKEEKKRRGWFR